MFVTSAFAAETATESGSHGGAAAVETGHGGAAAETHAGTEAGHEAVFPPFDPSTFPSQILWLALTFGLFYLFLKRVVMPRVGSILEDRRDRIATDLDQAAKLKEDADAAIAAYEQNLAEARKNANVIGQGARDSAKAEAETSRKAIEADLDKKIGAAETRIASIKSTAMQDVGAIAEATAAAIVEQLVGGKTDPAAVADAVRSARS